jgi:signal transduction histidine kinase
MRTTFGAPIGSRVHELLRVVLLVLCGSVAASQAHKVSHLAWLAPLAVQGVLASRSQRGRLGTILMCTVEGALVGAAVASTGSGDSPYLPYVMAPAFTGGVGAGLLGGVASVGAAAVVQLLAPLFVDHAPEPQNLSSTLAQWVVLAAVVAAVAAWMHSVLAEASEGSDTAGAQMEAFRLLTELRGLARRLPGTLDPETSGETMLDRARAICRYDTGAVLASVSGSQQLAVVARHGADRPHWDLSLAEDAVLVEAWLTQQCQVLSYRLPRTDAPAPRGSAMVVPLLSGSRTFGLLVLESGVAQGFSQESAQRVADEVAGLALQLQTGLVFDEVRELATHEERRRLAREIHDGIAQELASMAYALDNVAADLQTGHEVGEQVDRIREEVRRLVTELRMSLFDLRSDVDPDEGLGAAIGRHVRTVGTASGMTVHLSLNEAPVRLGAETEAELLRIVQEAVTNARKHSQATNLWVSCTVDPPAAVITVEDDGTGMGNKAADSYGLAIMGERAARIRADLQVGPREPNGTRVQVTLGMVRS